MLQWSVLLLHLQIIVCITMVTYLMVIVRNAAILLFQALLRRSAPPAASRSSCVLLPLARMPGRTRPLSNFSPLTTLSRVRVLPVLLVICLSSTAAAGNWTSFQNGGAVAEDSADFTSAELAWTASTPGHGQSSPVVWGDRAYVTSVTGEQKETYHVCAVNLASGQLEWQHDVVNATPQENSRYVSLAAPTPVVDESGVTAFFEGGNLVALTHDGTVRWERNLVEDYGEIKVRHGLGASLAHHGDCVFVWVERADEPYLLAVSRTTGETIWKVAAIGSTSWSSPRLVPVPGGRHLVLSAVGSLTGFDPATGDRLWAFDEISGNSTPTPQPVREGQFLIGATVGRGGKAKDAARSNGLIEVAQAADGSWTANYVWRAERATSSFGSPVAHQGLACFVNKAGVLYGLDLTSGEERFAGRIGDSLWATPVPVGHLLCFPCKSGEVVVITPGEKLNITLKTSFVSGTSEAAQEDEAAKPTDGKPDTPLYAMVLSGQKLLGRFGDRLVCLSLQ